jgi:hypothetical protein
MALAFGVEGRLGLNIADFKTKLIGAKNGIKKFATDVKAATERLKKSFAGVGASISKLGKAAVALGAVATAAIIAMGKATLETADNLQDMSDATNSTAAEIQAIAIAFANFDLEADTVGKTLDRLADKTQDALNGSTGVADAFRLVGISIEDLKGKRPAELFELLNDAIANTEDPIARQSAVITLLGKDVGSKLTPALLRGADGFKKFYDEAKTSGAIMSGGVLLGAANASDALTRLKVLITAGLTRAFAEFGPMIELAANKFEAFLNLSTKSGESIIPSFKNILKFGGFVADVFQVMKLSVYGAIAAYDLFKLGVVSVMKGASAAISAFGNTMITVFLGPLKATLGALALFSDQLKIVFDAINNFEIELKPISDETFNETLNDATKSTNDFKQAWAEPMPSSAIPGLIEELETMKAKLEETANATDALKIRSSKKSGTTIFPELDAGKKELELFGTTIRQTLGSELQDVLSGNFENIGDAFKSMLINMAADAIAADIANSLGLAGGDIAGQAKTGGAGFLAGAASFFGGGGKSADFVGPMPESKGMLGAIGDFFGGFFASGGRPPVGKVSVVGERGPELFKPDTAGTIIPNGANMGQQQLVTNVFNISTRDAESFRSARGRIASQIGGALR